VLYEYLLRYKHAVLTDIYLCHESSIVTSIFCANFRVFGRIVGRLASVNTLDGERTICLFAGIFIFKIRLYTFLKD